MLYGMAAVCALGAAALLMFEKSGRLRAPLYAAALAAAAAACVLAAVGQSRGPLLFRPSGAPEEAVSAFFDAVRDGDEALVQGCLAGGEQMPAIPAPEDEASAALFAARREGFSWALDGETERSGLEARVPVRVTAPELEAMREDLRAEVMTRLKAQVDARAYDEVYDENGLYRPEVTDEAYREAVAALLAGQKTYETSRTLTLRLRYEAGKWRIVPDGALFAALGTDFASEANNAKSAVLDGLTYIRKIYRIGENDFAAPAPRSENFGTTTDPAVIRALIDAAAPLLEGQDTVWSEDIELAPNTEISYYSDETILVIVWKELIDHKGCTFAEVRIADPSQFRRRLSGDSYDSHMREYCSRLAGEVNAVLATNGDFYAYRQLGVTVFRRELYRFEPEWLDTCFFTAEGEMLLVPRGSFAAREEAESFIRDNDVLFSAAFGPILIRDGELQDLGTGKYKVGQGDTDYSRSAIAMTDRLHYLLMTINFGTGATVATIPEAAQILYDKGCVDAYALDGGQTAELWMNGKVLNNIDWNAERQVSDIFYFASALPEGKEAGA